MVTREELLKAKVEDIGQQGSGRRIAFLATLLTCGGRAWRRPGGEPEAFYDFSRLHGIDIYQEELASLTADGLIQDLPDEIRLNYGGDDETLEQLSDECAQVLFETGRDYFLPILRDILSRPEGEYALTELARVGTEDTVHHVVSAIGSRHWDIISEKLKRAGLLVIRGFSRKHTYYAVFPPLRSFLLLEDERLRDALAHVYIGQRIRSEGILQQDCVHHSKEIEGLLVRGLLGERWWYSHHLYFTTPRGDAKAREVVSVRLQAHQRDLIEIISQVPQRALRYLVESIFVGETHDHHTGRQVFPAGRWGTLDVAWASRGEIRYLCLLNAPEIRQWRDRILEQLTDWGLAVKARSYVSTRGGEIREQEYVLAPEVQAFLLDYAIKLDSWLPMPAELEEYHKLYHFLDNAGRSTAPGMERLIVREGFGESYLSNYGLAETSVHDALRTLSAKGVVTYNAADGSFRFRDETQYRRGVTDEYFRPVVKYLVMGRREEPPPKPIPETPQESMLPEGREPRPQPAAEGELIILGADSITNNYGLLGWTEEGGKVVLNLTVGRIPETGEEKAQTISVFGVQGSGKSYTTGVILEMALKTLPAISTLSQPLAGIVFHYSRNEGYAPEYVGLRYANQVPADVQALQDRLGVTPAGLHDVLVLVPAARLEERRQEFPHIDVQPLYFDPAELGLEDWQLLMGVPGSETLYMEQVKAILQSLRHKGGVDVESLWEAVQDSQMTSAQKRLVAIRLELANRYLKDGASLRDYVRPGRLTVLDIRDAMVDEIEAMRLCLICLRLFQNVKHEGRNIPKVIVLDEAHKYLHTDFAQEIDTVVREMRHTATSVVIASQDPLSIPEKVIGLSSIVVLHRITSPDWLRHIKRGCAGLGGLEAQELSSLQKGEAYVWAKEASEQRFIMGAVKVRVRPRVTQHGL